MLLVRHAQSEWNALGRWQGQADPPLSELGRRQARVAGEQLDPISVVVSSPLQRARETAAIVRPDADLVFDDGWKERDAGEWSGLTKAEIADQWPGYLEERRRPPGFEPEQPFRERVLEAVERTAALPGEGTVLVVTHGGCVYTLERHLGVPFEHLPNLAGRWLEVEGGDLRLGDRVLLVDPQKVAVTNPGQL